MTTSEAHTYQLLATTCQQKMDTDLVSRLKSFYTSYPFYCFSKLALNKCMIVKQFIFCFLYIFFGGVCAIICVKNTSGFRLN